MGEDAPLPSLPNARPDGHDAAPWLRPGGWFPLRQTQQRLGPRPRSFNDGAGRFGGSESGRLTGPSLNPVDVILLGPQAGHPRGQAPLDRVRGGSWGLGGGRSPGVGGSYTAPGRPLKTRLTSVSSGAVLTSASAQAGAIFASGARKKPVPICAALAPSTNAAATPRASAIPPVATTGTSTALTIAGSSAMSPTCRDSASTALKAPRWPPASAPCPTITSAPAATAARAAATA